MHTAELMMMVEATLDCFSLFFRIPTKAAHTEMAVLALAYSTYRNKEATS